MLEQIKIPHIFPKHSSQSSWVLKEEADTIKFGKCLVNSLKNKEIILLNGPLGAGKTSLVKGIAEGLSIKEPITSPTFALSNQYLHGKRALIHLDLYRLEDPLSANELFIQEEETANIFKALMVIEWPSRLTIQLKDACKLNLQYLANGGRTITLQSSTNDARKCSTSEKLG